jgi:L-seryl-tRNA(Ser) seleniumtransferase
MAKAPAVAADSASLRSIPSVERILSAPAYVTLSAEFGRELLKVAVVEHLSSLRAARASYEETEAIAAVRELLAKATRSTLRRTINGTGILIHTNLGRSPIDPAVWSEAEEIVAGYSNLEFDLESGERGARESHLTSLCQALFGCEAALLTNNNAAGTMLLLAAVAAGKEVVVSRGELVEIGGSFRVPEVIEQGGARLREVGTTNRTRAADYAEAITRRTAAMLRVHRSNFDIVGFTETPSVEDLIAVSRTKRVPLLFDEGSGCVVDLQRYGFAAKTTVAELITLGVDAVSCSTDKLIGATQGGLILGRSALIEKCRRHPLMRALRVGKETYGVVAATLRAFATGKHEERIPIYRMLATSLESLRRRADMLVAGTSCRIIQSACALGGGTTPTETIPSLAIEVPGDANALHARLLRNDPPVVGRIHEDRFLIDVRTLMERDVDDVKTALRATLTE